VRPDPIQTVLGLMACTGLRTGEALNLLITDVQLDSIPPRLLIRKTKFGKSRWVPLHQTTAERLRQYIALRQQLQYTGLSAVFFISAQGDKLDHNSTFN